MPLNPRTVIAITGLPTSGKTALGLELAKTMGLHFVDIDDGPAKCAPPQEADPHHSEESKRQEQQRMRVAYSVLHAAVEANLACGFSLIIAATYFRIGSQKFLLEAIEKNGGNLKIIWCQYNDTHEEIFKRIQSRLALGAIGGCRSVAHYMADKERYEGINLPHIVVKIEDDQEGLDKAVQQAQEYCNN